jgi:2-methylcitrate dehydratase PrpD
VATPDELKLDRAFIAAQKEWHIVRHGLNIKRYPICYATHRSIDAVLDLIERYDLSPERVERIHVSTGKTQSLMLRNSRPKTGLEAKFSMQFAMAAALVARRVGLSELSDCLDHILIFGEQHLRGFCPCIRSIIMRPAHILA